MRIAFMGSPDFAVPALHALGRAGHTIAAVFCKPARPAGRGKAIRRCPVHIAACELGLPVHTPARLRSDPASQAAFAALALDVAVVAAYGLILPQAMLDAPKRGCLNVHASILPRWRGAAPIQAAILAGDPETGITIMRMEAGLDTGPILLRQTVPITPETTTANLHDTLALMGAELILDALASSPGAQPQCEAEATYAPKLSREDGWIDWSQPAAVVDRQVRAFDPWPGTHTILAGNSLKILSAKLTSGSGAPGTVLDRSLTVACGCNAVRLIKVQLPGRAAVDAEAFLRGHPVPPGTLLGRALPVRR
ncbi:MAG: methionyl-tRNA formyltransferase [Acetobacteraceae bacterium]|jgi:methionyl-tRNA formyltransferase|nr:methionyl-tRNA formyltransferase [Acetobacteraceae bacterium]